MIILKQVTQYTMTNGLEATWVGRTVTPAMTDEDGNEVPEVVTDVQVKCHSYADVQMQMFRDDAAAFGTPLTDYEAIIADIESKIVPYVPPPPVVPTSVNMWRARVILLRAGLLDAVLAAMEAMPEPARTEAKIIWEFAPEVDRYFGFVPAVAYQLGLTDKQLDDLFIAASNLQGA